MAARGTKGGSVLVVPNDQPLIGIPDDSNGQEIVRYFASEADVDAALSDDALRNALAGAWSHLDWEQSEAEIESGR
jgi:hypothetical protein